MMIVESLFVGGIMSKRLKFFIGHLACSFIIALIVIGIVFFVWFPSPLAYAEGVTKIFLMLLVIDVILGPALCLLIYKEGKKTLKMDLSIIILIQVFALIYGVYTIAQSRPAWIVQNGSIFQLVRANHVEALDQQDAKPEYNHNDWGKPQWVAVDDQHPKFGNFIEPTIIPYLYTSIEHANSRISNNAKDLSILSLFNPQSSIDEILEEYPQANGWLPLRTSGLGLVVLVNKSTGDIIKVVNLRPWEE